MKFIGFSTKMLPDISGVVAARRWAVEFAAALPRRGLVGRIALAALRGRAVGIRVRLRPALGSRIGRVLRDLFQFVRMVVRVQ